MTKVCICQICTCGRHRCPHHPQAFTNKGGTPCLLSEYANKYHPHPIDKREPIKPKYEPNSNAGPLEDKTTNRVDFVKYPYEKPFVHQSMDYVQPDGAFDHMTNYTKDYPRKSVERAKLIKKDGGHRVSGKFEGHPTYKHDYRRWSAQRERPIIRDQGYRPSSQPFEGLPTYQKDYIKHPHAMRGSLKPAETARHSDQPFDDRTGYRDEYIKHPLGERYQKEKPQYAPNAAKLDDLSNYKKDYTPKEMLKTESCKPSGNAYQSNAPFEEDTTQRVDFKKWPTERPFVHEHEQYCKPEGHMEMNTTSHTDYTKKPLSLNPPARPASTKRVPGKFDDTTNYKEDFRKWQTERTLPKVRSDYQPNQAPFEGLPTYQKDYIKHNAMPPHSLKPADTGYKSGAPFEDCTEYRTEYLKKSLPPCPAGVIEGGDQRSYTFREQDQRGHKWYEPTMQMGDMRPNDAINTQLTALSVA